MTILLAAALCAQLPGTFKCDEVQFDKNVQIQLEMTVEQCQGMPGIASLSKEIGDHYPGRGIRKWVCTALPDGPSYK